MSKSWSRQIQQHNDDRLNNDKALPCVYLHSTNDWLDCCCAVGLNITGSCCASPALICVHRLHRAGKW